MPSFIFISFEIPASGFVSLSVNLCSQANNGGLRNSRYVFLEKDLYRIYNFQTATKMSFRAFLYFGGILFVNSH